ncbi:MAG: hypothetical protein QF473_14405, partial [Planctomycetota bacterium]|nr:hypothetical protein [Planctomycetota bacterium]
LNTPRLVGLEASFETASGKPAKIIAYPSARTLAEGEALTVVGRTESRLPAALLLRGKIGGRDFERRYSLAEAEQKAEFIPRFWAKRHIDEMLKYGEEHKDEIIRLSKQYYVMTPYTSLIVLENEAMYKEFKVERGRKDHWALYPAPKTIEVVKEPVNWSRWSWWGWKPGEDEMVKAKAKPKSVQEIVDSVQFRINAPFYYWRPQRQDTGRFALYGLLDSGSDPTRLLTWLLLSGSQKREYLSEVIGRSAPDGTGGHGPDVDTEIQLGMPPGTAPPPMIIPDMLVGGKRGSWAKYARGRLTAPVFDRIAETGEEATELAFGEEAQPQLFALSLVEKKKRRKPRLTFSYGYGIQEGWSRPGLMLQNGEMRVGQRMSVVNAIGGPMPQSLNFEVASVDEIRPLSAMYSGLSGRLDRLHSISSLSPQLVRSFAVAFDKRMARIDRDIRQHNAQYGGYWGDDWSSSWNNIDLRKSASARWYGGLDGFEDEDEERPPTPTLEPSPEPKPLPLQAMITSYRGENKELLPPSFLLSSYGEALNSLPGTTGALAVDFLAARRHALLKMKRTKREDKELAALRAARQNLSSLYPRLENPAIFWSHQGWSYRPRPWTFQQPQVQAYHHYNWTFDLTRYADGLYSTSFDMLNLVAEEYGLGPVGKVGEKARQLIERARRAIQPIRLRFEDSTEILFGPGDRMAHKRTTEMYLEEQLVCDGESILHLYPELGIAARRRASTLRRASLRQFAPHLLEPGDWLARQHDIELAEQEKESGRFVLSLTPRSPTEKPDARPEPSYEIRMTVATDGRLIEKSLYRKGERQLRLVFEYEDSKVTLRWLSKEDKELAAIAYQAEPLDSGSAFRPDLESFVVYDMPLRKPSYYEQHLKEIEKDEGKALAKARLLRHLALAHVQELNWRRWGGSNQQAFNALTKAKSLLESAGRQLKLGDLSLLGSCGYRNQVAQWRAKSSVPAAAPLVAYYQHGWRGGVKPEKTGRPDLMGHLAAYAYTASHRKTEDLRRFIREWKDSPLLLAAAFHCGNWGRNSEAWFELFDHPRWRLQAVMMSAQRAKTDAHKQRIAAAFDAIHKELIEKGYHAPFSDAVANLLKSTDKGKHWKPVIERTWEAVKSSEQPATLLWFAELGMFHGETQLADRAVARAKELMGDAHPVMNALALGQAYWAGGRTKEALGQYDKVIGAMEANQIPKSPALLAAVARLAMQSGDAERAIELEEQALALEHPHLPELINLRAFRSRYQWLWGRYQQALQQAVNRKDQRAVEKWLSLAESAWHRWYEVDQDNAGIVQQLATLQLTAGRKGDAWRSLSSIIDRKPKEALSYFNVGQWYRGRNEKAEAAKWYAEAAKWDTANPRWLFERAKVLKEMGNRREANVAFQKIIDGKWAPGLQGWVNRAKRELK